MELVYSGTHRVYYNTKKPVPIADVIIALQALEGLLKDVPKVISGLTGVTIVGHEFIVEKIESGSLAETILVKLFFKNEQDFEQFLDKIRENGVVRNTIVAVALGGLLTYGLIKATGSSPAPNITANNNTIINIGAGEVKMTPEAFQAIVQSAVGDKKETAKNAIKFLAPNRHDPESSVSIEGTDIPDMEIPPRAIREVPEKLELPSNDRREPLQKVEVLIRATDLDSRESGWAGRIEGKTTRLKIKLGPGVSESDIFGRTTVLADVAIISKPKSSKTSTLVPKEILIERIYPKH